MALIEIKSPLPKEDPLVLVLDGSKVYPRGGEVAMAYWKDIVRKGLFDRYGHPVDTDDVGAADLYAALVARVPKNEIRMDKEAKRLLKESAKVRPPEGGGIVT